MTETKRTSKNQKDHEPDYNSMSAEELRDHASQSLADFALGKITTEELNARTRKTNARMKQVRPKEEK